MSRLPPRRRPRRRSTALAVVAPSSLVPFRSLKSTLARTPEEIAPSIHPSAFASRLLPARSVSATFVRSFCEVAEICAQHHHRLPARPNNWQWLYPPKGRIDQLRRRHRHLRVAAFPGRNMCHSDWQLQCTCALWLVRGGVINSHQYDQDSTVKPPTHGRGIVSFERVASLLFFHVVIS